MASNNSRGVTALDIERVAGLHLRAVYHPFSTLWAMMNDPARAVLWTALQAELLVLSAILVGWYLVETWKLRKAAENQLAKSQELVEAALRQIEVGQKQVGASNSQANAAFQQLDAIRQQVALAQDQLEGQIRPALVARINNHGVELVNIGSGPALHVQLSPAKKGLGALLTVHPFPEPHDQISFLEPRQARQTVVQCQVNPRYAEAPVLDGRSLQCTYKSLWVGFTIRLSTSSARRLMTLVFTNASPNRSSVR